MSIIEEILSAIPLPPGSMIVSEKIEAVDDDQPDELEPWNRIRVAIAFVEFSFDGEWQEIKAHYDKLLRELGFVDPLFVIHERRLEEQLISQMMQSRNCTHEQASKVLMDAMQRSRESTEKTSLRYSRADSRWDFIVHNHPAIAEFARSSGQELPGRTDCFHLSVWVMDV